MCEDKIDTGSTVGKVFTVIGAVLGVLVMFSMVYFSLAQLADTVSKM